MIEQFSSARASAARCLARMLSSSSTTAARGSPRVSSPAVERASMARNLTDSSTSWRKGTMAWAALLVRLLPREFLDQDFADGEFGVLVGGAAV